MSFIRQIKFKIIGVIMRELLVNEYEIVNGGLNGGELGQSIGQAIDKALSLIKITTHFADAGLKLGAGITSISEGKVIDAVGGIASGIIGIVSNGISIFSQIFGKKEAA